MVHAEASDGLRLVSGWRDRRVRGPPGYALRVPWPSGGPGERDGECPRGLLFERYAADVDRATHGGSSPIGGAVTGRYFDGMNEARAHEEIYDPAFRSRLGAATVELLAPFLTDSAQATG